MSQKARVRDLLRDPAWREEDVGFPLPDSPHACLVSLPTWPAVIGYEESDPDVVGQMRAGYPRFFIHPITSRYMSALEERHAGPGERLMAYSSPMAAKRAETFVEMQSGCRGRTVEEDRSLLVVPAEGYQAARDYWKHTGELISSRQAEDRLKGVAPDKSRAGECRAALASVMESAVEDVFFFESGMAAIFTLHRIVTGRSPGKKTLQLCFPYVDALKVQQRFGSGVDFVNEPGGEGFEAVLSAIREGVYAAVFCEVPSNPLLTTVDLTAVAGACRDGGTPLLVDDTVCSHLNVDLSGRADAVSTSLTKWVSGIGDVMAGSVRIHESSPFAAEFREGLAREVPEGTRLYPRDMEALVQNAKGLGERVAECNSNGLAIAEFLQGHKAVSRVWYPAFLDRENYESVQRPGAGFGGLMSFTLKAPEYAPEVYRAMRFSKGPSLGTDYSLLCPYAMLAHYTETEWANGCGVATELLRLSVGREPLDELRSRLEEGLSCARG